MSRRRRTTRRQETENFIKKNIKKFGDGSHASATDAYGEIDFGGSAITPAKYVRVAHNTKMEVLYKLLAEHWKLKSPNLIISVTGGAKNFKLRTRLKEVFQKSLIKVAKKTKAWITTGGTHAGVMKHVGKAVENYGAIGDGQDKVVTIGIATWGAIFENGKLVNGETGAKGTQLVKHYDAEESKQEKQVILDNNHSHFILVDDGTEGETAYGGEITLRTELEGYIAKKKTDDGIKVMIVCVIVQGGPGSLETVAGSVKHGTPVVIVEGSSGWADVLADAYKSGNQSFDTGWVKSRLPKDTGSNMDTKILEKWTEMLNTCISNRNLLYVFSLNPSDASWDLDVAILKVLLNARRTGSDNDQQAYNQLELMMAWNRSDIAKLHILDEDTNIQKKDIAKLFFSAIQKNKYDFCKVLLDYGVNLKKHCTVEQLKKLYKDSELIKQWEENEGVQIKPIGKVMKKYLGHLYDVSVYEEVKDSKKYSAIVRSVELEDPYKEIFQWAILMNYREIARHIWEYMFESMSAAIMATRMLKRMAKKEKKHSEKRKQLLTDADEYEALAAGIQLKCFSDNPHKAVHLLTASLPRWGGYSCLQIAVAANDKLFVSMPGVRHFLENRWRDDITAETSTAHIILAGICPLFVFTVRRNEIEEREREVETIENTGASAGAPSSKKGDIEMGVYGDDQTSEYSVGKRSQCWWPFTFYNAPIVKFWMNVIFFLIYLMLFSFILLSNFEMDSVTASVSEYVLLAWMITLSFEEIRELYGQRRDGAFKKFKLHIRDPWNVMDILSMLLFYVGFGMRFSTHLLNWTLNLYSFTFMIQCVRIVHIFAVHHLLGPKITMVWKMLKDLLFFLFILIVFLLAYGVASQALLYPGETSFTDVIIGIVYRPYWQIYGELFLDEIDYNPNATEYACSNTDASLPRCPRQNTVVPIISAVYLLLANVLLLNLLIAMFSYTFENVQSRSDMIWMFERYKLIASYHFRPPWVPPLIIISHVIRLGKLCCGKQSPDEFDRDPWGTLDEEKLLKLRKWERWRVEEFIREKHEEADLKVDKQVEKLSFRIDNIMSTVEDLQSRLKKKTENRHAGRRKISEVGTM